MSAKKSTRWLTRRNSARHRSDPDAAHSEWELAPFVAEPDEAAYYDAIAKCETTDGNYMRSLRILTWWSHNDRYRNEKDDEPNPNSDDPRWRENVESLLAMPIQDASDEFMKIEILRQLGRQGEALSRLGAIEGCEEIKLALHAAPYVNPVTPRSAS